ncbi:TetR/AcrR family transcriptional regulator [Anaerosacchariphilus polymeriproducens]|uniref:TetR/AcrR family transcriptional regulator n=1 Tax=Anaerosacchariphilus polymeriproducens TaxID=1812858 RepID=A0A371AYL6_9FIRM|nr:TetR/AcrR family transcriptional regulator [Anaerosacchariphilus polymeriproducens]RDU24685.1 TetR/AcrR family transcriptional regulator [Anaerosacchariphilus polymeriproducens]
MEDRRKIRTKRVIKETFLDLLKEKEINKISVAELADRADIGRGTFYLHYKDIYDLYEQFENEIFDQLEVFYDNKILNSSFSNVEKFVELIIEYIFANKEIFQILIGSNKGIQNTNKFKEFFKKKEWELSKSINGEVSEYQKVESAFTVAGVVSVLEEWVIEGMIISPDELEKYLKKILLKF